MRNKKIRYILIVVTAALIILNTAAPALAEVGVKQVNATYSNIKVFVDGKEVKPTNAAGALAEPVVIDGTVYMPVKEISGALGKGYEWDAANNTVYIGQKPGANTAVKPAYYMLDVVPAYQTSYDGNEDAGDNYREYSASVGVMNADGHSGFLMNGVQYINGAYWYARKLVLNSNVYEDTADSTYSVYNLDGKYTSLFATAGHVDGSGTSSAKMYFYADDIMVQEFDLTSGMSPLNIKVDVTGARKLRIMLEPVLDKSGIPGGGIYRGDCLYGLGELIIQ